MDSSGSSKLRKGLRKFMDKLTVSRSRSRSRSPSRPSQLDPKTMTSLAEFGGINTSPTTSSARLEVPTVAEPIDNDDRLTERDTGLAGTGVPTIMDLKISDSTAENPRSIAWNTLRTSLRLLHGSAAIFPPLSSAVEVLLSCVDRLETAAKHREDYEDLATTLVAISDSLKQHASTMMLSDSMSRIALSLKLHIMVIKGKLDELEGRSFRDASTSEEELIRHYRRVQSLFQQLQANASLSALNMINEQTANTRLEGLYPVKQATYDSNLSTPVNRRGCTEGTRATVLKGLEVWLQNSSSASIYWMNGMAGTGKTTIAYTFCERVDKHKQLAASFFCTRNTVDCRNTSRIVPTIAYQLARYSIPYQSALCKVLGQNPDIGSKHLLKQFEQLLIEPLQQVKAAIPECLLVVIDALDECDDRNGIELVLGMLLRCAEQVPLKFLITSRPEPEIYNSMQQHEQSRAVMHLHDIESSLVRADIELYLTQELAFISPHLAEVEQLAHRSGCLFIYAATLVRYIRCGKRVAKPRQRLQSVLSLSSDSTKKHAEIDALYTAILESALYEAQMEEHETEDVQTVLRTVLFAQEPIDINTIALLGGLDDSERVLYALQPLRSVIHQSEQTGLVSTLHASFPDYLLSYQRSGVFFCDVMQYNQPLAQRCFEAMKSQLRFNICALRSSFVPDDEVEDLEARVKANITPTLGYVCQYWANHLGMATESSTLLRMLVEFLSDRLLFWMEVLNLLKMINTGIDMLHKANAWINQIGSPAPGQSIRLVEDSHTFVTNFAGSAASRSTPHIYISCLPFCSRSSQVYGHYWKRTQGLLELQGSLVEQRSSAAIVSWQDASFRDVAFSSDGSRCVGGLGNAVLIRKVYNGAILVGPMLGHTGFVCACAFSVDGSKVVSASSDGTIRVWDAYSGRLVSGPFKYDTGQIVGLEYPNDFDADPPENTRIAASFIGTFTVYLLDANDGTLIKALNDHTDCVNMLAISPDGTLLASASDDLRLWNLRDGTPVARPYEGHRPYGVRCLAFTPDGNLVVSCVRGIHIWRMSDGSLIAKLELDASVTMMAVSPDGTQVAYSTLVGIDTESCTIRVWKIDDASFPSGPYFPGDTVKALMYSPDGTRLTTQTGGHTVAIWPVKGATFSKSIPLPYFVGSTTKMVFSADGTYLVTSQQVLNSSITKIWDVRDGSFAEISHEGYVFPELKTLHLSSPDGRYAITMDSRRHMHWTRQVINTTDNSIVLGPELLGEILFNVCAQFSQDSTKVVTGFMDGTIGLWDLESRVMIAEPFVGHEERVSYVTLSPDNSLIASIANGNLKIINIFDPILDITTSTNSKTDPPLNPRLDRFREGWFIENDGWMTNINLDLLFFMPLEFRLGYPSLHTSLIITQHGIVQIPKQALFLGEAWDRCYNRDDE